MPVKDIVNDISKIEGKEYRRYFADVLDDNTDNKTYDYEKIYNFIIYDNIPTLADLSEHMIRNFNEITEKLEQSKDFEHEISLLLESCKKEKNSFLEEKGILCILYYFINSQIERLNNELDYYKSLTLSLINIDVQASHKNVCRNTIIAFKYCTDKMIYSAKQISIGLVLFEDAIIIERKSLSDKINNNKQKERKLIRWLIFLMSILSLYLFIA